MQGKTGERWRQLCAEIATEQDPDRFMELTRELNELLEAKEFRLKNLHEHNVSRPAEQKKTNLPDPDS